MANSIISKINFALGRNPAVKKRKEWRQFVPEPFSTVIIIQADFELAWAWRWAKSYAGNSPDILQIANRERKNIPRILDLCDKFRIPITWAAVGHLLLECCERDRSSIHPEIPRLGHFKNEFWEFNGKDWFDHDPGSDVSHDPEWYAPDLIKDIIGRKVKHEIGCHTFSHIDCRKDVCSPEILQAELNACQQAAARFGITLRSFVHPGHTIGNLDVLEKMGFTSFRSDYKNVLEYPECEHGNLWELKSTMELAFRQGWSMDYHIHRYQKIIDRALKSHTVCIFWFHPSLPEMFVNDILPEVFRYLADKNQVLVSSTSDYINWLNGKKQ